MNRNRDWLTDIYDWWNRPTSDRDRLIAVALTVAIIAAIVGTASC